MGLKLKLPSRTSSHKTLSSNGQTTAGSSPSSVLTSYGRAKTMKRAYAMNHESGDGSTSSDVPIDVPVRRSKRLKALVQKRTRCDTDNAPNIVRTRMTAPSLWLNEEEVECSVYGEVKSQDPQTTADQRTGTYGSTLSLAASSGDTSIPEDDYSALSAGDNLLHPTESSTGSLGGWKFYIDHLLSQNLQPILFSAHFQLRQRLSSTLVRFSKFSRDDFEEKFGTYIAPKLLMQHLVREFWNDMQFWHVDDRNPSDLAQTAQQTHADLSSKLETLRLFANSRANETEGMDPDLDEEGMQTMVRGMIALYEFWRNILSQASSPPRQDPWVIRKGLPTGGEGTRGLHSGTIARLQDWSQFRHLALSLVDKVFLTWLEQRGFSEEDEE